MFPEQSFDFVLSCHSLEHVANPLKALAEWRRVVRPGGYLVLVLPNKSANFDHRRPTTTMTHLLADFTAGVGEDDLTHLPEILALHDLERDRAAGTREAFAKRSESNFANRGLHHHIFDLDLLREAFRFLNLEEVAGHSSYYDHLIVGKA
jgi:SAM-dependent methyltransferase